MFASITTHKILRNNWQKLARKELIFIMKTSAEKYLMPFCHCSILQRGFRFVAWSVVITQRRFRPDLTDYRC